MTFELLTPTTATLKSVTPRTETHGDDVVVALSLRLEIEAANTLLDALSPRLRHALYEAAPGQDPLPGVEPSTPLLRFNAFEPHALKACFEGWTLKVDHGIEEHDPITLGGCKVDAFRVTAKQGGTVVVSFRAGTNDVSSEEIGLLCGKLGSAISFTLKAPEKAPDAIDASSSAKDLPPDATDLFSAGEDHGGKEEPSEGPDDADDEGGGDGSQVDPAFKGTAWPFPKNGDTEPPPQSVVIETSRPGTRTARGREKTAKALAAGKH